ncbi:MAG: Rieske (2Fe-2S) protein [Actinomycetota bacterium]
MRARVLAPFAVAALAGGGVVTTWVLGGHTQVEGALGAAALGAMAVGLVGAARRSAPPAPDIEPRHPSLPEVPVARRRFLAKALAGAVAVTAIIFAVPLRGETRRGRRALRATAWTPGARLVTDDGRAVHVDDLDVGGLLTVYPEGRTDAGDSQVVLVRLEPGRSIGAPGRADWAPAGYVAYSKLCTHMGCPVGLYQQRAQVLLCPCHQASFDVIGGGRPVHGPARRPLPQLPVEVGSDGFLRAIGDFPDAVGPGWWDRPA